MNSHSRWRPDLPGDIAPKRLRAPAETKAADALAQAVYDRRTELGLSRLDLARRANIDEREITRLEDGPHMPTPTTVLRLDEALSLSGPTPPPALRSAHG